MPSLTLTLTSTTRAVSSRALRCEEGNSLVLHRQPKPRRARVTLEPGRAENSLFSVLWREIGRSHRLISRNPSIACVGGYSWVPDSSRRRVPFVRTRSPVRRPFSSRASARDGTSCRPTTIDNSTDVGHVEVFRRHIRCGVLLTEEPSRAAGENVEDAVMVEELVVDDE